MKPKSQSCTLLAGALLLFGSCATTIAPRPPELAVGGPLAQPPLSSLVIPVSISRLTIESLANQKVPEEYQGNGQGTTTQKILLVNVDFPFDYDYRVRRSPVIVTIDGGTITMTTKLSGPLNLVCRGIHFTADTVATVEIHGQIEMLPDWSVNPHLAGSIHVDKADVLVGFTFQGAKIGFDVSLAKAIQDKIQGPFADVVQTLSTSIKAYDIRSQAQQIWNSFRSPMALGTAPPTWLAVAPQAMNYAVVPKSVDEISINLGLLARASVLIGGKPPQVEVGPLPVLGDTHEDSGFQLAVPISAEFASLNQRLDQELAGHEIPLDQGSFLVRSAQAFGKGHSIVLKLSFHAKCVGYSDLEGIVFLIGKLTIDPTSRELRLVEFDYDGMTSDLLLNTSGWLAHGSVAQYLSVAINKELAKLGTKPWDEMKVFLNGKIKNLKINDVVSLHGVVEDVKPVGIDITAKDVTLLFEMSGTAGVSVDWNGKQVP